MITHRRIMSCLAVLLVALLVGCGAQAPASPSDTSAPAAAEPTAAPAEETAGEAADEAADEAAAEESGADATITTGRTSNYDSAPTKITMWVFPNGQEVLQNTTDRAEEFARANPDIGVQIELVDWSVAYNQLQTALQGGADACVTQIGTTWVSGFHPLGGFRPFTEEEIAAMGGADAFVQASWATTSMTGSDEVIAIPWFVDVRALAYRADLLEQVGLTPEEAFADLDAFEATLKRIKEADLGVAPFSHTGRGDWNVVQNAAMFMWNFGAEILSPDLTTAVFNSPEAVAGVHMQTRFFGEGLTPPDAPEINTVQAEARMGEGAVFSVVTGPWMISNILNPGTDSSWQTPEVRENIDFIPFPAGPGGQYTFVGGSQLSIFNECPHPEAAVKFVQHLVSPEAQVAYSRQSGFLPALIAAQDDPAFASEDYVAFKEAARIGKVPPTIVQWGAVENELRTALEGVWEDVAASPGKPIDEATIKARLDAAVQSVNDLLAP